MKYFIFIVFAVFSKAQEGISNPSENFPKECGTMPVVHSDYKAKGTEVQLQNDDNTTMKVYETGRKNNTRVIIVVYDIFGFHPNTKQVADKVAELGDFRLVMPDFYRSVPWDEKNFPPKDWQDLVEWVHVNGNWTRSIRTDVLKVLEHYKAEGGTTFGMFGFCWGGGISVEAGTELADDVKAIGLVHPSFVDVPVAAERIKGPIIVLPSQNEPDYIQFFKTVKARIGDNNIETVRFDDMMHGFAAARGDLSNVIVKERVQQVIQLLINFFNRHLMKNESGTPAESKSEGGRLSSLYFLTILMYVFSLQ